MTGKRERRMGTSWHMAREALLTFFNYPTALNVEEAIPFGEAMGGRAITAVANTVFNVIVAALGYGIATLTGPKAGE